MKKISITVDGTGSVSPVGGSAGFYGEHLATELEITLSGTFSENCEYYKMNIDGYVSGRLTPTDGKISYTLPQSVLRPPAISCQVIGYKIVDDVPVMVVRSAPFTLNVTVSPQGESPEIIETALEPLETALAECGNTVAASKKLLDDISGAQSAVRKELTDLKDETVSCASTAVDCVTASKSSAAAAAKSASEAAASAAALNLDNYYKKTETYSKEQVYSKADADKHFAVLSSEDSIDKSSVNYAKMLWYKSDDTGSYGEAELNDDYAPGDTYIWSSKRTDAEIKEQSKLLCNALKGTKSGSSVRIEDVSPTNGELKIKLTSDTVTAFSGISLKVLGKNLIPYPYSGTSREYNGITWTVNADGSVTANGTATEQSFFSVRSKTLTNAGQYFLSGCPAGGTGSTYSIYLSNSDYTFYKADYGNGCSIKMDEDKEVSIFINIGKGTTVNHMVFKPQLELGAAATEYEKGKKAETYTPNTDGTVEGVTAVSHVTTLTTNNSGVVLNCEYSRDINKAFAELQQAIISLGGNI